MNNSKASTVTRLEAFDALVSVANAVSAAEDYGDMLGAIRLVELAAQQARRAVTSEAASSGETWKYVAGALGMSSQAAHQLCDGKDAGAERGSDEDR